MEKICYSFCFLDEDGEEIVKDVWAYHEREACVEAESIAWVNGYTSFELLED